MAKLLSEQQQRYWQGWLADCKDEESSALSYVEVQDIRALLDHIEAQEAEIERIKRLFRAYIDMRDSNSMSWAFMTDVQEALRLKEELTDGEGTE